MSTVMVAAYACDSAGRLAKVADPRTGLATSYGYAGTSTSGQPLLTTITPPGQAAFTLAYGEASQDDKSLLTVTRAPASSGGKSAKLARFVYGVDPSSPVAGLPAVDTELVSTWGQVPAPSYGAAVFSADRQQVAGSAPSDVAGADWPYGDVQYTDRLGRVVNTASYGAGDWQYTSTSFDEDGREIRSMDANGTAQVRALSKDGDVSQDVADSYATITRYNAEITATADITWKDATGAAQTIEKGAVLVAAGALVTDVWAPATEVSNPADSAGAPLVVREHTHTDYDQGAPNSGINPKTGARYNLATTVTTYQGDGQSGSSDPSVPLPTGEAVTKQSLFGYNPIDGASTTGDTSGWLVGSPTTETTLMGSGQANIVSHTKYDAEGRTIEARSPGSSGTDAATTTSGFYSAGSQSGVFADCGNKPEWAGLACSARTGEIKQSKPVTTMSGYSFYLAPTKQTEVLGAVTRATDTVYDNAGRVTQSSTTVTGLDGSTPVPATKNVYDPDTGLQTETLSITGGTEAGKLSTGYDSWGRVTTYTDADGVVTTTTYDDAGRVKTVQDALHTTTNTYDSDTERRGLVTKMSVSDVGDYTATYDATGAMTSQTLFGKVTEHLDQDRSGNVNGLSYTGKDADGKDVDLLAWSMSHDVDGRIVTQTSTVPDRGGFDLSRVQSFTYDRADRLVTATDATAATAMKGGVTDPVIADDPVPVPTCTTRAYEFDPRGNRTGLDTKVKAASTDTPCGDATSTASKAWAYDDADRVQHAADGAGDYAYDVLGRQTTIPGADTPNSTGGNAAVGYYDDDSARSITQGQDSTVYTLNPAGRRLVSTLTTPDPNGGTRTEEVTGHYTDDSDNPTYATTKKDDRTLSTWYGGSIGGDLAATVTGDQTVLSLIDSQGSIATSITLDGTGDQVSLNQVASYDEYGNTLAIPEATGPLSYGWLGGEQRATDSSGLLLMGARLYNPVTGLFASVDPVTGGNTTDYAYPQDPVNNTDLDGRLPGYHKDQKKMSRDIRKVYGATRYLVVAGWTKDVLTWSDHEYKNIDNGYYANGIRHFVWMAGLALMWGAAKAKRLGDLHEQGSTDRRDTQIDQHNNSVTRNYIAGLSKRSSDWLKRQWWTSDYDPIFRCAARPKNPASREN